MFRIMLFMTERYNNQCLGDPDGGKRSTKECREGHRALTGLGGGPAEGSPDIPFPSGVPGCRPPRCTWLTSQGL